MFLHENLNINTLHNGSFIGICGKPLIKCLVFDELFGSNKHKIFIFDFD